LVVTKLDGDKATFDNTEINLRNINSSSATYDQVEKPKMINPEVTNPEGKIKFKRDGFIESEDERFAYTIDKCKIDRTWLNDERKHLLKVFERDIRSALVANDDPAAQQKEISAIVTKFVRDSQDKELQFLGFKRFAISSGWLAEIAKEMN
jgi:hypothetical protein